MQLGDSHEGQQRRKGKVEGCGWKDTAGFTLFHMNILAFVPKRNMLVTN